MPLINMKSKPEVEEMPGQVELDEPSYPYGLCIRLGKDELEKLGVTALPKVGSEMMISAKVFVKSVSSYQTQGAGNDTSMELQITDMEIGQTEKATNEDRATALYGAGSEGSRINGLSNALYGGG
jgi:hypothetical protein